MKKIEIKYTKNIKSYGQLIYQLNSLKADANYICGTSHPGKVFFKDRDALNIAIQIIQQACSGNEGGQDEDKTIK